MDGEVIKSFLVGLGFGVDDESLAKFNKAIASATVKVAALYGSIQIAAAGIFASISGVSKGFEDMGYQLRLIAPAMNRWLVMRQAMLDAYAHAGVNLTEVVKQAVLFNYSLAKTKFALEAVYKSVAAKFFPLLTKQMDIFRLKIFANMPKIQSALMKFVEFIFKAFKATVELGTRLWSILTRVYDFFVKLDKATNGWSTVILGVAAAWKLLNLEFLATPLGMLIAGLTTILALYDDFKVWQEGGKSLINWGSDAAQIIIGLTTVLATLAATVATVEAAFVLYVGAAKAWTAVQAVLNGVMAIFTGELDAAAIAAAVLEAPIWLIVAAVGALTGALTLADSKWKIFGGGLAGFFKSVGGKTIDLFGGGPNGLLSAGAPGAAASSSVSPLQSITRPSPLLPASSSSQQTVSQQTHITVNGAADANSVGKRVVSEQDRVNFDMTRNLKGAAQ